MRIHLSGAPETEHCRRAERNVRHPDDYGAGQKRRAGWYLQYAITSSSLRWQNKEFDCRSEYGENNARLFVASMRNLNGH